MLRKMLASCYFVVLIGLVFFLIITNWLVITGTFFEFIGLIDHYFVYFAIGCLITAFVLIDLFESVTGVILFFLWDLIVIVINPGIFCRNYLISEQHIKYLPLLSVRDLQRK